MSEMEGFGRRPVEVRVWGQTDVGRSRKENQDSFLSWSCSGPGEGPGLLLGPDSHPPGSREDPGFPLGPRGAVLLVADGMGGAAGGARASRTAIATVFRVLESEWGETRTPTPRVFVQALRAAVAEANRHVHEVAQGDPALHGMGTTLTLAGLLEDTLYLAQVGDSRGCLVRHGRLWQLTRDQSMIQELLDAGALSEAQARVSPQRSMLLQALGTEPRVDPVLTSHALRRGDLILLCSDGLSGPLEAPEIAAIAGGPGTLQERGSALIAAANERGGPDNITVVLAHVGGEGLGVALEGESPAGHRIEAEPS